jgi:menaquinone-specific isochorismate synthase
MQIYWSDREGNPAPDGAVFSCHPFFSDRSLYFQGFCEQLKTLPIPSGPLRVRKRYNLPEKEEWIQNVDYALSQNIEKVVLARCQVLELEEIPDPFAIAATLKTKAEGAFVFCIKKGNKAFVGASPERLFSRKNNILLTEAMAGTRPRGKTEEEDRRLQKEMLLSTKDLREISPIQTFLKRQLKPLCSTDLLFSPLTIHKTHNVQHLYSQGNALLKTSISDLQLLKAIHPTPALCGAPQNDAFNLINKLEPFERGLYGGVIGWSYDHNSEWIVGIRSCFIFDKTVHLFSGAGIVKGSTGADEWDELNHKLKLFNEIFH